MKWDNFLFHRVLLIIYNQFIVFGQEKVKDIIYGSHVLSKIK